MMSCETERASPRNLSLMPHIHAFCKNKQCPSTDELLHYHQTCCHELKTAKTVGRTDVKQQVRIKRMAQHLAACDFCCAEFDLLSHHAPDANESQKEGRDYLPAQIPTHLYVLASNLLARTTASHAEPFAVKIKEPSSMMLLTAQDEPSVLS